MSKRSTSKSASKKRSADASPPPPSKLDELQFFLMPVRIAQAANDSVNWIWNEGQRPDGKIDVIAYVLSILKRGAIVHAVWDAQEALMGHRSMLLKGEKVFEQHHLVLLATKLHEAEFTIRVPDQEAARVLKFLFVDKLAPPEGETLTVAVCVDRPGPDGTATREVFTKRVSADWVTKKFIVH